MKKGLIVLIFAVIVSAISINIALANDMDTAKELLYGNWGPYATDWVKYKLNCDNVKIKEIRQLNPMGTSFIDGDMLDRDGQTWLSEKNILVTWTIKYDPKMDKYILRIDKHDLASNHRMITEDEDFAKKFVKVYWDNDQY